jgi:signal peptidase I
VIWAVGAALATAVGAAVLITLRRRYLAVRVEGASMEPTLRSGQVVLVRRVALSALHNGQVVVVAAPGDAAGPDRPTWLIKRILALPGDPVPRSDVPLLRGATHDRVPPRRFVVIGDNRALSLDSRQLGYLHEDTLLGIVTRTLRV